MCDRYGSNPVVFITKQTTLIPSNTTFIRLNECGLTRAACLDLPQTASFRGKKY